MIPAGVGELLGAVAALERVTKVHADIKRNGPHCPKHPKYDPACVPCIEAGEEYIRE